MPLDVEWLGEETTPQVSASILPVAAAAAEERDKQTLREMVACGDLSECRVARSNIKIQDAQLNLDFR